MYMCKKCRHNYDDEYNDKHTCHVFVCIVPSFYLSISLFSHVISSTTSIPPTWTINNLQHNLSCDGQLYQPHLESQ